MWVESMEKKLEDAEPTAMKEKWKKHCIFLVPPRFKVGRRDDVFTPQTVALGPFHHDDPALHPMEKHKLRAVQHVLRRAEKPLRELAAAVEDMAEELEDAYAGLDGEWRGENRGKFMEMMVADGCFLLEVMRSKFEDYDQNDPVFGKHAMRHIAAFVQRDMLLMENQLPLSLLRRIVAFEEGPKGERPDDECSINNIVAEFLWRGDSCVPHVDPPLALHPLDVYRRSLLRRPTLPPAAPDGQRTSPGIISNQRERYSSCCLPTTRRETRPAPRFRGASPEPKQAAGTQPRRSAKMLWDSGVRFKPSGTSCYDDIRFDRSTRRLEMPELHLDDSTEHELSNLMAFEALHAGAGNAVTAFVLFMMDMVDSEHDVKVLRKGKVLEHDLAGSDAAVVSLFNRLTMDVSNFGDSDLCGVRRQVDDYCDGQKSLVFIFKSWAKLRNSHLSSPWAFLALVFSLLLIGTDITQTVFAVMSYRLDKQESKKEHAPAPKVARWITGRH